MEPARRPNRSVQVVRSLFPQPTETQLLDVFRCRETFAETFASLVMLIVVEFPRG